MSGNGGGKKMSPHIDHLFLPNTGDPLKGLRTIGSSLEENGVSVISHPIKWTKKRTGGVLENREPHFKGSDSVPLAAEEELYMPKINAGTIIKAYQITTNGEKGFLESIHQLSQGQYRESFYNDLCELIGISESTNKLKEIAQKIGFTVSELFTIYNSDCKSITLDKRIFENKISNFAEILGVDLGEEISSKKEVATEKSSPDSLVDSCASLNTINSNDSGSDTEIVKSMSIEYFEAKGIIFSTQGEFVNSFVNVDISIQKDFFTFLDDKIKSLKLNGNKRAKNSVLAQYFQSTSRSVKAYEQKFYHLFGGKQTKINIRTFNDDPTMIDKLWLLVGDDQKGLEDQKNENIPTKTGVKPSEGAEANLYVQVQNIFDEKLTDSFRLYNNAQGTKFNIQYIKNAFSGLLDYKLETLQKLQNVFSIFLGKNNIGSRSKKTDFETFFGSSIPDDLYEGLKSYIQTIERNIFFKIEELTSKPEPEAIGIVKGEPININVEKEKLTQLLHYLQSSINERGEKELGRRYRKKEHTLSLDHFHIDGRTVGSDIFALMSSEARDSRRMTAIASLFEGGLEDLVKLSFEYFGEVYDTEVYTILIEKEKVVYTTPQKNTRNPTRKGDGIRGHTPHTKFGGKKVVEN